MINLTIDGVQIAKVEPKGIAFELSAESMRSAEKAAEYCDFNIEVEVPISNREACILLSGEGYLHNSEMFNHSTHIGVLWCDGVEIISGEVILLSSTIKGDRVVCRFRLRRSGAAWAISAMTKLLREVDLEYSEQLTTQLMTDSWTDETFVKFLPVHRDSYTPVISSAGFSRVKRLRSVDDFHPFIHVATLFERIFSEAGYSVQSDFLASDMFQKLYVSGQYVSQESSRAKAAMDFNVVKLQDHSATADYRGRVNITPLYSYNSVGQIVDIDSIQQREECYSLGGCLAVKDSVLTFTPTQAVSVGFELRLKYVTDYTLESRDRLKAFDSLYLDGSLIYDINVENHFVDQRYEQIQGQFEYLVVIFGGSEYDWYQLSMMVNGKEMLFGPWGGRKGRITTPRFAANDVVENVRLYLLLSPTMKGLCTQDWALYMGYVETEGAVEVDVTLRTPPMRATPTSPIEFTAPYIDGADEGMNFTLKAETSIKPYFAGYPGYGSNVNFADLAQLEFQAADFVESIRQLFNLAIYSDVEAKKVYIEPMEQIYDNQELFDWSDKIVQSEGVRLSDLASDAARVRRWGYQQSDGVTTRIATNVYTSGNTYPVKPTEEPEQGVDGACSPKFGMWEISNCSLASKKTAQTRLNKMFTTTLNDTEGLPIVGDRDNPDMVDTLRFSPRILSLDGVTLKGNDEVPNARFFSEDQGLNLCFEDRDGVVGLNRYYRDMVEREERGQYAELTLRLTPSELSGLCSPVVGRASMLSTFRLTIGGEVCEARLESVKVAKWAAESERGVCLAECKFLITK